MSADINADWALVGLIVGVALGGLALIALIVVVVLYVRGRKHVVDRSKAGVFGSMMALVRDGLTVSLLASLWLTAPLQKMLKSYNGTNEAPAPESFDGGDAEEYADSPLEYSAVVGAYSTPYSDVKSSMYSPTAHIAAHSTAPPEDQLPDYLAVVGAIAARKAGLSLPHKTFDEDAASHASLSNISSGASSSTSRSEASVPHERISFPPPVGLRTSAILTRNNTRAASDGIRLHSSGLTQLREEL